MHIDLIRGFILTEKAFAIGEQNKYVLDVDLRLTKPKIKALVEELFDINVLSVNTHILARQKRRVINFIGYKPQYKRAVLTLAPTSRMKIFD